MLSAFVTKHLTIEDEALESFAKERMTVVDRDIDDFKVEMLAPSCGVEHAFDLIDKTLKQLVASGDLGAAAENFLFRVGRIHDTDSFLKRSEDVKSIYNAVRHVTASQFANMRGSIDGDAYLWKSFQNDKDYTDYVYGEFEKARICYRDCAESGRAIFIMFHGSVRA